MRWTRDNVVLALAIVFGIVGSFLGEELRQKAFASRNSSGTYSLPAGNPVVSGTTISSTVHNNTMSDIATELTNSLDRQGRGAMTEPLQLDVGSAAAPGATFDGDPDTGLYRIGANNPGMSAGGALVMSWGTTGVSTPGFFQLGSNTALASADTPNLTLRNSNQSRVYMEDTRGATGNKVGRIVYDGSSLSGGTGNLGHPGWQFQAVDDSGAFSTGSLNIYRGGNPAATVGFTDYLTRKSLVKAWAKVTTNGAGGVTLVDGFNVASASLPGGNVVRVTIADDMANTAYAAVATSALHIATVTTTATTHTDVAFRDPDVDPVSMVDPAAQAVVLDLIVVGAQ